MVVDAPAEPVTSELHLGASARESGGEAFPVERIREDFPALTQKVHGKRLVYLDSAASSLKPQVVVDRLARFYAYESANVHRGVHFLSQQATDLYESARARIGRFLGTSDPREVVFTRGATEAVNLVAHSFLLPRLRAGDEVLVTALEHHANIVPWQLACEQRGARLRVVPMDDRGVLDQEAYARLLGGPVKLVAMSHVSNALGTVNPVAAMVAQARARGIPTLVDGAQAVPHMRVDVNALGCDFYVFSGHKTLGPTGIGILYGRFERLCEMGPYQGGGDMIVSVSFEGSTYQEPPQRFEAGTPNIGGAIALATALDYLEKTGLDAISAYEGRLLRACEATLQEIPGVRLIGTAPDKAGVVSFEVEGIHPHDLGTILDQHGVAIRAGHHCAQPVMERLGVPATARASLAFYNDARDLEALRDGLLTAREIFG